MSESKRLTFTLEEMKSLCSACYETMLEYGLETITLEMHGDVIVPVDAKLREG